MNLFLVALVIIGICFGLAFVAVFPIFWIFTLSRTRTWRSASSSLHLGSVREKKPLGILTELRGEHDGFGVAFKATLRGDGPHATHITIDGQGQIPIGLSLRAEGLASTLQQTIGYKELEVGDPRFDDEVYVRGPEELLLPLLDDEARTAVRKVVAMKGRITDGTVRVETQEGNDRIALDYMIEITLRAACALRQPRDVVAAIQERLTGASPGQVALSEDDAGHVSLTTDADAGQVSLSPEDGDAP